MGREIARYRVIERLGTGIGRYGKKLFISIEALDSNGKRVRVGKESHFVESRGPWYWHYKSGLNKASAERVEEIKGEFEKICIELNSGIKANQ